MTADAAQVAAAGSWVATGLGVGLWIYGWTGANNPIRKLRFQDAGMVLVFSSILLRVLIQERAMTWFDWIVVVLAPVFIAAALWRLKRTTGMTTLEDR